uniref:Kinesin motor domain-containing protein n=1 Tax=Proboscia inermis TaxID=420281 RepID=A0A7S0CL61_9STRA|mmetsp:Transcript_7660/g.7846  ORF Transcript_7660/g.7846 Transcript_7660/m.7846 type:complete len:192 (+) Transcript_7660:1060-1635(+)
MVACMSPADYNVDETVSTLRYATSACNIKIRATRNIVKTISPEEAAVLQRDNQLLRTQVEELQEALRQMQYISSSGSVATTACSTVISSASIDMAVNTLSSAKTRKFKPPGGKHDKKSAIDNNITTIDTKADKADIYDDNANSTPKTPSNISPADNYEVAPNDKPNERESIEITVNSLPTIYWKRNKGRET